MIPRRNSSLIPKNPQSVVAVLFPYLVELEKRNVSRYAAVKDYHVVGVELLTRISGDLKLAFPQNDFVPFIDDSPIPEVTAGVLCGLGVLGDNGLLINPKYGSWTFIGELVTDLKLEPSRPGGECLHCGICKAACPGGSLSEEKFAKETCVSYLSQKKGSLTEKELRLLKLGGSAWGCDICQERCPMNKGVSPSNLPEFKNDVHPLISLGDYDKLSSRAFSWRPKDVIERNLLFLNESNQSLHNR